MTFQALRELTQLLGSCEIHFLTTMALSDDNRRSSRLFTRLPVRVAGRAADGRKFRENSQTIVINAHGCLLYLRESVEVGSSIHILNPATEEEQECRVVFLGDSSERGQRVGIEFLAPSPHFWGVDFAPEDWPSGTSRLH